MTTAAIKTIKWKQIEVCPDLLKKSTDTFHPITHETENEQ